MSEPKRRTKERWIAMEKGEKIYFDGKACRHGHVSFRRTSTGACIGCEEHAKATGKKQKYDAEYAQANRASIRENLRRWKKNNKGKVNAETAARHAAKMQRQPKWLTKEERNHIRCIYQVAAMRNRTSDIEWHVDHIVPMQGENVCGLHVPWNLRVIPAKENIRKGNRLELELATVAVAT